MKLLFIVPVAVAVTLSSAAFADAPKKDTSGKDSKDSKSSSKGSAPKEAPKAPSKDTGKTDSKPATK